MHFSVAGPLLTSSHLQPLHPRPLALTVSLQGWRGVGAEWISHTLVCRPPLTPPPLSGSQEGPRILRRGVLWVGGLGSLPAQCPHDGGPWVLAE